MTDEKKETEKVKTPKNENREKIEQEKQAKLAAALRQNLLKRKAQSKSRKDSSPSSKKAF